MSHVRSLLLFLAAFLPLSAADRPNILWIFSEDLSPYMGCYDDPINKGFTPVIDKFAKDGVLFKRAFVPAPVCSACRSAMITGVLCYAPATPTPFAESDGAATTALTENDEEVGYVVVGRGDRKGGAAGEGEEQDQRRPKLGH